MGMTPKSTDSNSSDSDSNRYMDVEKVIVGDVIYEEQASLLNTLSFTIGKDADVLLRQFGMGQSVILYGGYYDENGGGTRKVFSGTITRIRTMFPDDGVVQFSVEAMSYGFVKMGKDNTRFFNYPDKNSQRKFCKGKTSITLTDIVKGIADENGMFIGNIKIPEVEKRLQTFTEDNVRSQNGLSDWAFLSELADAYSCYLWTETNGTREELYFVDKVEAVKESSGLVSNKISFLYPRQGEISIGNLKESEIHREKEAVWSRPRIIRNVSLTEDISMAYAVSRSAQYFDKKTGEYVDTLMMTMKDPKTNKSYRYLLTLDEDRVKQVEKTNPTLARQIRNGGGLERWSYDDDITKDDPTCTRYYYKTTKLTDENVAVFDKAFYGIFLTATVNQDLDIKSQRYYSVRGILRYSSNDTIGKYFLRGLKHIWGVDGATTELDLIM